MSAIHGADGGRNESKTAVDHSQRLVGYLDSSAGDVHALRESLGDLEETDTISEFTVAIFADHLEAADDCLDDAWNNLEGGDDPLLSPETVLFRENQHVFAKKVSANTRLQQIASRLNDAVQYFNALYSVLTADSTPTIETSGLTGDFGVYDTLDAYVKYVRSELFGMRDRANLASTLC